MAEILQSYKLTVSAINAATEEAGRFAQRFLVRLVELVNDAGAIEGMKFRPAQGFEGKASDIDVHDPGAWAVRTVQIPLRDVMLPGVDGTTHAKRAIKAMQQAIIDYTDKDPKTGKTFWTSFSFVGRVTIKDGIINADIEPEVWRLAVDFSMGYRAYELGVLVGLRSLYSMKLYPYLCRQTDPNALTMSIEDCKKFMGVADKYKGKPLDFIRKCIDPAKEELDRVAPWSFDYEKLYSKPDKGKTGRPALTGIRFIPRHQLHNESPEKAAKAVAPVLAGYYSRQSRDILRNKFGIENLNHYTNLFAKASKIMDIDTFVVEKSLALDKLRGTKDEVSNPAGWFIAALKDEVNRRS